MGRPLIGPAAKLSGGSFTSSSARRLLFGLDHAILWHRGSLESQGLLDSSDVQPRLLEPEHPWGEPGSLPRLPQVLIIVASAADFPAVEVWADEVYPAFRSKLVSIAIVRGGSFPFRQGLPVGETGLVDQDGTFKNPKLAVADEISTSLYRGGRIMVASITKYRVAFLPDDGSSGNNLADYFFPSTNGSDPEFPGYDQYPDSDGPNPLTGFTVFAVDAASDLAAMQEAASRLVDFQHIFYQSTTESQGSGVGATDSSLIPEEALDDLMGSDPRLSRQAYDPSDMGDLLDRIRDDAMDFFS